MKPKKQKDKFKKIILDIYYRLRALPMLFLFWILLLVWKRRTEKWQARLFKNRERLNEAWQLSSYLGHNKYDKQQRVMKKFEKDFLLLEEDMRGDEEHYLKQRELFEKYLAKVFDPHFGNKSN